MRLIDPAATDFDAICREFRWSIPDNVNVAHHVCERHQDRAEQVAVYYENAAGERASYRFADLKKLSDRFANALRAAGIDRGDRVAIVLPQTIETVVAHLAIHKLGAVSLPLAILFGPEALDYRLRDSGARAAVVHASRYDDIKALQPDLPDLQRVIGCRCGAASDEFWALLEKSSDRLQMVRTLADDPACLIYTSGTTGPPKGALIAHRAVFGNFTGFEMSQNFFPRPGDVFWTPADWAWTGGLWDALFPALNYGMPIVAYEGGGFDAERVCRLMSDYAVTNAFIPPTALKMLRALPDIGGRFDLRLRAVMSAGEQVGEELIHWGRDTLGLTINEMWGQTEFNYLVGNCSAIMPPRPGSMGKPYPGHRVDVIDDDGNVVADGEEGELAAFCDDPVMFLGYWNNPDATRDKITANWFRTGDVGYRDEDGFLWFVGRKDDVISSAGYRIGPGEIEDSLLKHPAVQQVAVIGKPDELRGQIVKAFVVLSDGYAPNVELATEIQQSVRTRLSAHEYPREIEFIDSLPMTTTGKVRRIDLRAREIKDSGDSLTETHINVMSSPPEADV
ncbi:MAG: AMP-binding protein [Gammaproteobacteria bacterium]|nr:AMP-binding protein [Gammaproteobacteria bacterium]MDH3450216.1 AMP-binding protein [Gammaproteobacteria bacterium]